jgi:hypothetical protein
MRPIATGILLATALFAASCDNDSTTEEQKGETTAASTDSIRLTDFAASPDFPNASLGISGMQATKVGTDSVKLSMTFNVQGYDLKAQTQDAGGKMCNNSDKGQHIHFILDNQPYVALYEPKHETTVAVNTEHYILCFLSRSYHESVKHKEAAVLAHIRVDEKGTLQRIDDTLKPMVFYSRPKGDYLGKDTANVLLDFYPTNVALGGDYKVKADIRNESNGRNASFTLNEWKPKFIQGLGTGKASVTLTLVDKDGRALEGANTSVTRNFNLAATEPLKP